MFKGKLYLYKNTDGKEEKIEKEFDNEKDFSDYVSKNPELKKMESEWKELKFPATFEEMVKAFDDFDKRLFGSQRKTFFDELDGDFKKIFDKAQKLLK